MAVELTDYASTQFGRPRRTLGRHGYVAYFPAPIPRAIELPVSTIRLLADAEASLGRLAGVGQLVGNPHLLIRPYLMREALSSTRIEGTQASLADVFEVQASGEAPNADVEEVLNYIDALELGSRAAGRDPTRRSSDPRDAPATARRRARPRADAWRVSEHPELDRGKRIHDRDGVIRPPAAGELPALLADWERYAHETVEVPLLVQNALLHYQFETLHPFLDGNGRIGRLLSVFLLVEHGRLPAPLLYLSAYLERDRARYYDSLQAVRQRGDAVPWIELFLAAVRTQAADAVGRSQRIVELRERYRAAASTITSNKAMTLVDLVCETPIVSSQAVEASLGVTRPTALKLLRQLEDVGVLTQGSAGPRGQRRYLARELMAVVTDEGI